MKILKISLLIITFLLFSCQNNNSISNENKEEKIIKNKVILALWDSLTAWYWLDLSDAYPAQLEKQLNDNFYTYKVVNAWVSGDTSSQILERIDLYLSDKENIPEIAILVIWWNDWLRWKSIDELSANIELIIKKLKEKNIKIILWWMQIPPNLWLNYSNDFKWLYKKVAKKTDVYLIDFFLEWIAWNTSLNINDWIHPNKMWYEIISKNIFEFLKSNKLIQND